MSSLPIKPIKNEAAQVSLLETDSESQMLVLSSCVFNKLQVIGMQTCLRTPD